MIAQTGSLLVVEDDADIRESLADYLRERGYRTETSGSCADALARLGEHPFDVVLCDVQLPDGDGFQVLEWCVGQSQAGPKTGSTTGPETGSSAAAVIMLTGYGTIESAVDAMRIGAFDYLTKPVIDDELDVVIGRAVARRRSQQPVPAEAAADPLERSPAGPGKLIGRDPRMEQLFELIENIAGTRITALILGESGTGKTLTARAIHEHSDRCEGPFVEVSCGALSETLLESELFGHVAGAFTGAMADRPGRFRQADGGTLFLDEIASASPALQVRLLRVLQDREYEPVGGTQTERVDVRLVVATNEDLEHLVRERRFRQDLFYRINVITLTQPPLRERMTDIPLLAETYRERFAAELGRDISRIDRRAIRCLCAYHWPGNVRELVNVIERAVVLCRSDLITTDDLPEAIRRFPGGEDSDDEQDRRENNRLKRALAVPERRLILDALESHGWNRQQTARSLGINRTTLYKKMKRFGIAPPAH